ncbi:hypothetical protein NP493_360g03046 [Ridgeia piscesae]|uniref:Uncharacterized protein n=1 Tax=Ridgeia piscesae TaxID=27915 RepID=A0AAD9NW47_RIDPI|nr:hypothetical protein NP493_360g03046 [Ridgeia piscesae]
MTYCRLLASLAVFVSLVDASCSIQDVTLRAVTDDFWAWKLREFPEQATKDGFHQYDDKLESYDPHSFIHNK